MKKRTFLLLLLFLSAATMLMRAQAQTVEPNLKWGKPTDAELKMTAYEADPEAKAVELCRTVSVFYQYVNGDFRVINRVRCRLKVLKPEGKDEADRSIVYRKPEANRTRQEVVIGLKATAYNLEDGKLVKTKMENAMVHEERLDKNQVVLKFSVPQVRVGTVVEYEYRLESDFYYDLRDWYAQRSIPVLYTSYELSYPEWFSYNIEETGFNPTTKKSGNGNMSIGETSIATNDITITACNLPALKDDGFVWAPEDYGNKVTHELRGIYIPGAVHRNYTSTWDDIDKTLLDDEEFGGRLKNSSPLKAEIQAAGLEQIPDRLERAAAVYQLLKKHVRWNNDYAFWAKSGTKILKEGTGTNADLNFLYINMLHDAGIDAMPVVLRSRTRGRLPYTHASMKYLSTFVVGIADTDSTLTWFDASSEDGWFDVLPAQLLVDRARVVRKGARGEWVNLQAKARAQESAYIHATLSADGVLTGQRVTNYTGQAAATIRRTWRTAKDTTELLRTMEERNGIEVSRHAMEGRHDFSNVVRQRLNFTKQCDATGDLIYLNPLVFVPNTKNPFTAPTRHMPVEFPYKQTEVQNVVITLPEGYEMEEQPRPIVLRFDGITARIIYAVNGNQLTAQYRMVLDKTFFTAEQYPDLKAFYDKLIESNRQLITIKKKTT